MSLAEIGQNINFLDIAKPDIKEAPTLKLVYDPGPTVSATFLRFFVKFII